MNVHPIHVFIHQTVEICLMTTSAVVMMDGLVKIAIEVRYIPLYLFCHFCYYAAGAQCQHTEIFSYFLVELANKH